MQDHELIGFQSCDGVRLSLIIAELHQDGFIGSRSKIFDHSPHLPAGQLLFGKVLQKR